METKACIVLHSLIFLNFCLLKTIMVKCLSINNLQLFIIYTHYDHKVRAKRYSPMEINCQAHPQILLRFVLAA